MRKQDKKVPVRDQIPAGFDFFQTAARGAEVHFEEIPIPPGFFANNSEAFAKTVKLRGRPLRRSFFKGRNITHVDTIVKRKKSVQLPPPYPSSQSIPIELTGLALESTDPIEVQVGDQTELWDVQVALSKKRRSTGSMTITKTQREGGVFDSQFTVFPIFRFTRRSDGEEKVLDVGALPLPSEWIEKITVRSSNSPWAHTAPKKLRLKGLNDKFVPGVRAITENGVNTLRDDDVEEEGPAYDHPVGTPAQRPPCRPAQAIVQTGNVRTQPYNVSGKTLAEVGRVITARPWVGQTTWNSGWRANEMCEGRVNRLTLTVNFLIELPRWTQEDKAGPNSRREWRRYLDCITKHENNHVARARGFYNQALGDSMLNQTKAQAERIFQRANTDSRADSKQYDRDTHDGEKECGTLDISITD